MSKTVLANLDGFTPVIDWMARDYGTNRALVFGRVWRYCQMRDGVCNASINTLSENTGLDEATIRRHLHELAADGFLEDLTPGLTNHPHTYRDTGKAGLQVSISALSKSEGAPSQIDRPTLSKSEEKIVVKKGSEERKPSAAKGAASISTVENEWAGTPPQVVQVPQGGNRKQKDSFTERCDMCQANLTQEQDTCPACGRPVQWEASPLADKRAKDKANRLKDESAKHKREQAESISTTTAQVLAIARASAPDQTRCDYAQGEEQALYQYELAYGAELVRQKLNEFKANNERGRGLIKHLLAYLAQHNPDKPAAKGNNGIVTDADEFMRQTEEYLLRNGGETGGEPDVSS